MKRQGVLVFILLCMLIFSGCGENQEKSQPLKTETPQEEKENADNLQDSTQQKDSHSASDEKEIPVDEKEKENTSANRIQPKEENSTSDQKDKEKEDNEEEKDRVQKEEKQVHSHSSQQTPYKTFDIKETSEFQGIETYNVCGNTLYYGVIQREENSSLSLTTKAIYKVDLDKEKPVLIKAFDSPLRVWQVFSIDDRIYYVAVREDEKYGAFDVEVLRIIGEKEEVISHFLASDFSTMPHLISMNHLLIYMRKSLYLDEEDRGIYGADSIIVTDGAEGIPYVYHYREVLENLFDSSKYNLFQVNYAQNYPMYATASPEHDYSYVNVFNQKGPMDSYEEEGRVTRVAILGEHVLYEKENGESYSIHIPQGIGSKTLLESKIFEDNWYLLDNSSCITATMTENGYEVYKGSISAEGQLVKEHLRTFERNNFISREVFVKDEKTLVLVSINEETEMQVQTFPPKEELLSQ